MSATSILYHSLEEAFTTQKNKVKSYTSLDGAWQFHYSPTPEGAPVNFYTDAYNSSAWASIIVPSNW